MQKLTKYNVNFFQGKINENTPYFLFQRPGQPIHIRASFLAGSRFDTIPGIAHFLEHMLLAGSKKFPNKRLLAIPLENIGGSIGGITNNDFITITLEIAGKKDLLLALDILNEVINNPLFNEETIENERGSILAEQQMGYHNRGRHVMDVANALVYQKTPYAKVTIGNIDSIKSITGEDLKNYYRDFFKKNPLSWSISGDIDEKEIIALLAPLHTSTVSTEEIITGELPIVREESQALEIFEDDRADIYFGFRTDSAKSVDTYSLAVISSYLAQGRGSKLQDELRYKRGLIYGIRGDYLFSFDAGEWYLATGCLVKNAQKILDVITEELALIKKTGISDAELRLVKNKIIQNNILKMQTAESWSKMSDKAAFIVSPEKYLISNFEEGIEKVTAQSIIEVANKYFKSDNWYLAMCGSKSLENISVNIKPGVKQE